MWGKYQPLSAFYLYMLWKSATLHSGVQIKIKIHKNVPMKLLKCCVLILIKSLDQINHKLNVEAYPEIPILISITYTLIGEKG